MKKLHHSKAVGCQLAEKLSYLRPCRCVDLAPRLSCDSDLDLGLHLSPIVEEMGLAAGELLDKGDAARLMVESGPAATDLPDSPSQVGFSAASLLPLEKPVVPVVMMCSESDVGMDEKGEGMVCSVQRNSFLPGTDCNGSVADFSRLTADVAGGEMRVPLVSDGGQEEAVQLGAPLTVGVRLNVGAPLPAGEGSGQPSNMAVAASCDVATPMTHSAKKGSGANGGSGHSYASAVGFDRGSDVRLHFVPPVKLDDERSMREGLGSVEADLRPDMNELTLVVSPCEGFAPRENFDPDLKASSEGLSLTMAAALPDISPVGFEARGCEEALGMMTVSAALSEGVESEKIEANLSVILSDESVTDGVPKKRFADGEEIQESAVGPDVLPSPCIPVSVYSLLRFPDSEDRGCGVLKNASPPVLVCAGEQGTGLVGGGVEQPALVEIGAGGEGGVGGDAVVQPTETICSILPTDYVCSSLPCVHSLLAHAVDTPADGFVTEDVRVSPTARGALRPQPTDGLW
ncbi:hypothetical protein Dimus_035818 [Dionaea muscipula]